MNKLVAFAAAISLGLATMALADVAQAPKDKGLYIGGNLGLTNPSNAYANVGGDLGVQLGYRFDKNFRAELASSFMANQSNIYGDRYLYTGLFMLNGYYDFYTGTAVTPLLGAGLGYMSQEVDETYGNDDYELASDSGFAYQGIVGLAFKLNKNFALDLTYHYVTSTNKDLISQNLFNLGFNYYLS